MADIKTLKHRDELGQWLNDAGLLGIGVEVGSLCGDFARTIMSKWKGRQLIMVDPWERQPDDLYREPTNHSNWDEAWNSCVQIERTYPGRVNLLKGYSPQAAIGFLDGEMDWVYIDANHSYDSVRMDIEAWWPKVKSGGLFGGHDFRRDLVWPQNCDVQTAVEDWSRKNNLTSYISRAPGCYSWWIIK